MAPLLRSLLAAAAFLPLLRAHVLPVRDPDAHFEPTATTPLPGKWYQAPDSPVHRLFRRSYENETDGVTYAEVGSPTWSAAYPVLTPDSNALPQAWVDALNAAVAAGSIPDVPVPTMGASGNPVYPDGLDPTSPQVCSGTYQCYSEGEIYFAPDGVIAACFDDGPLPPSTQLYDFLADNNVTATHFMIGVNIISYPDEFNLALAHGDDIAVHTYTHPYMTTLNNTMVLGELGWTMQLIHNSTGGRLPKYWRPPYGDTDIRVSAIAKEVFGLTTVLWNQDSEDWSIGETGGPTQAEVETSLTGWITGSKSPGLIILEHELTNATVGAYMDVFPLIRQNGWDIVSVAQLDGLPAYQNVVPGSGAVQPAPQVLAYNLTSSAPPPASTAPLDANANATSHSSSATPTGAAAQHANAAGQLSPAAPLSLVGVVTCMAGLAAIWL